MNILDDIYAILKVDTVFYRRFSCDKTEITINKGTVCKAISEVHNRYSSVHICTVISGDYIANVDVNDLEIL